MVTPGFHPIKGGTETVVRNLLVELNKREVHTDVMTFNMDRKFAPKWRGKIEKKDGITVFRIPALNLLPSIPSPRINMKVNLIPGRFTNVLKEYDIIHFHELDFSFPLFSFFVKKPKILHLHGIHVDFFKRYHLSRIILKNVADYYITITKKQRRALTELGINTKRILLLPNSIDVNSFFPEADKEDNLLLYLGRIVPVKGLHILLESLCYVETPVRLMIVGPIGNFDYYRDISKQIEKENQKGKHHITYLGTIPDAEVKKLYQKATIFILPSFWEPFGVVLLEALACGTPVVSTLVGGIPEIVQNHENGILVPPNNPPKLAEAIQYLMDNKDVRTRLAKEGRKVVVKNFSLDVITSRLCNIYQGILKQYAR